MKIHNFSTIAVLLLAAALDASADPKTTNPERIASSDLDQAPFRFNGAVVTSTARGSGFCAWHPRTFFSAAHVVYGESSWEAPPLYFPMIHRKYLSPRDAIQSRGYFRWANYSDLVADKETNADNFSRDVIIGYAFEDLIDGDPAPLNRNGETDLRLKNEVLITGYPAENAYEDQDISGFFLHMTGPKRTVFKHYSGDALSTTLLTTGPGNSGGPVWIKNEKSKWQASGVLVGGLPSECVVYAFSDKIRSLTRAVAPVVQKDLEKPLLVPGVSSTSMTYPYDKVTKIPDGVHKWTSFPIKVDGFAPDAIATAVKLSLRIVTKHRGDLQVILVAPGGFSTVVHNEQGADGSNLVLNNQDFSPNLTAIKANGNWSLRVQDRLKGDIAVLESIRLEISTEP